MTATPNTHHPVSVESDEPVELERGLSNRHIQLIAIGGGFRGLSGGVPDRGLRIRRHRAGRHHRRRGEDPERTLPRAINQVPIRILFFYVLALGVIVCVIPWSKIQPDESPFVALFVLIGVAGAAGVSTSRC